MKLITILTLASLPVWAQDTKVVMDPINRLFEGMKKGDSAMVHKVFHTSLTFNTVAIDAKTNQPVLGTSSLGGFLKAVGTPHAEPWNEVIWSPQIQVDGNFAQVWVNYAFYVGTKFSHCGVDAFHLFRNPAGEWKIFSLADTRRKEDCQIPKEISDNVK